MPRRSGEQTAPGAKERWPTVVIAVSLFGLVVVAVLLSRRDLTPDPLGIPGEIIEPVAHVAVGAVLAAVVGVLVPVTSRAWRVLVAFGVAAFLTTAIEAFQVTSNSRSASLDDAIFNLVGCAIGALAVSVEWWRGPVARRLVALASLAALIFGVVMWRVDVPLGKSCDHTVLPTTAEPAPDLQASDDAVVFGFGPTDSLSLEAIGRVELGAGFARFSADVDDERLFSHDATAELNREVRFGHTVGLGLTATPEELSGGHVAIAGISRDKFPSDMNLVVGADGDRLSVRLRMGCGHFNWTRIDDVMAVGRTVQVVVTVVDDVQRIWVDGVQLDARRFEGMYADTRSWDLDMPLVVGNGYSGGEGFTGLVDEVVVATLPRS